MTDQTFEDVKNFILNNDLYTESYTKKISGRLSSYARKSNRTLAAIPADLDVFELDFGKGRKAPIPPGYKSRQQANIAASEIRSALTAYLEHHAGKVAGEVKSVDGDDWGALIEALDGAGVDDKRLISVHVLANKCRGLGCQPCDVTHAMLMDAIRGSVTAGEYKAIQKGWKLLETNADAILPKVDLPANFPFPSLAKTRNVCNRLELPAALSKDWKEWSDNKGVRSHEGIVDRPERTGVKKVSLESYHDGLSYYYTCLITLGHLDVSDDPDLLTIVDTSLIEEIIFTEVNGKFPWDRISFSSLHSNITRLLLIATDLGFDSSAIRAKLQKYDDFKGLKKMVQGRKVWCQQLMNDPGRIAAFYSLPGATFKTATSLMKNYKTLDKHEQQQAIKASIAACAFAILLSLPFRIGTLLQLQHSGTQANVFAFQDKNDLIINSTSDMVKNGYAHERVALTPKAGGSPKKIVKWFIEVVHPLLVKDHVQEKDRDAELLFAGIGYHRLYHAIVDYAVDHGIDLTPHLFRHGIATLLANEPRADYALIAALLGDTVQTVITNYAFIDQAKLHAAGQDKLAAAQKNALRVRTKS